MFEASPWHTPHDCGSLSELLERCRAYPLNPTRKEGRDRMAPLRRGGLGQERRRDLPRATVRQDQWRLRRGLRAQAAQGREGERRRRALPPPRAWKCKDTPPPAHTWSRLPDVWPGAGSVGLVAGRAAVAQPKAGAREAQGSVWGRSPRGGEGVPHVTVRSACVSIWRLALLGRAGSPPPHAPPCQLL